jgi:hypothetical protein
MKNLEEIDCNEDLWDEIVDQLHNGWSSVENDVRFAFQTKDKNITEDDIQSAFIDRYPFADQLEVSKVKVENPKKGMRYFGVSMIIYESGI